MGKTSALWRFGSTQDTHALFAVNIRRRRAALTAGYPVS
jgi:hypothetical protein